MRLRWIVRVTAVGALMGWFAFAPLDLGTMDLASAAGESMPIGDEFDGPEGGAPNPSIWGYDVGGGGWGNNEQQVYTDSRDNSRLDGNGNLAITAQATPGAITSARLVTRGRADFGSGLVEARIKFPAGAGLHPAFWMLGSNDRAVGWPEAGEIDGMELVNTGTEFHNAVHGPILVPSPLPWKQSSDGLSNTDLSSDFHTYGIRRDPGLVTILLDGAVVGSYRAATAPPATRWVFDGPMYVVLNVAVGSDWSGPVTSETPLPAQMLVDWIRFSR